MGDGSDLVRAILKMNDVAVPEGLLNQDWIKDLGEKLATGNPTLMANYFRKMGDNIDVVISPDTSASLFDGIIEMKQTIKVDPNVLGVGDQKILKFLASHKKAGIFDFLRLAGPMYGLTELLGKVQKTPDLDRVIVANILLNTLQSLYELLLQNIDGRILTYIKEDQTIPIKGGIKNFMDVNRDDGDHATAGQLNTVFVELGVISKGDQSIFTGDTRKLRNKSAHFGLFYDSQKKVFVFQRGGELTWDTFTTLLGHYYLFLVEWLQTSIDFKFNTKEEMAARMKIDIQNMFYGLSKAFRIISRAGLQRQYRTLIIRFLEKKEETKVLPTTSEKHD